MKTKRNISNLKNTGLMIFSSLVIFAGSVYADTNSFSPNAYMVRLEALFNDQAELLKYKAPVSADVDISVEMNALECLFSAIDDSIKYKAPEEDEYLEVALELENLETLFSELEPSIKYNAPEYADMVDETYADENNMIAENK